MSVPVGQERPRTARTTAQGDEHGGVSGCVLSGQHTHPIHS